jgi:imidazolonepropionase-like amidohydrolase
LSRTTARSDGSCRSASARLEAEVTGGLTDGERIIIYPSDAVAEGVKITPRN